jgi:response regulator RpfG family c-di-GMP phosphodiesterase
MSNRPRLLIVDDNKSVRELLELYLLEAGYQCVVASDGIQGLGALKETDFDLLITDIMMPGISGVELIKKAKTLRPDIATVVVSATTDIDIAVEAINSGAQDYITKPFDPNRLYRTVNQALEVRNLRLENIRYREHLEDIVNQRTKHVQELFFSSITSLAQALEEKDPYTKGHSRRVAQISCVLGKAMELSNKEISQLDLAGQLHDIGKIGIPDRILLKPSSLSNDEYEVIKTHPSASHRILQPLLGFRGSLDEITMDENGTAKEETLAAILHHHERYDGKGYPSGLRKDEIPLKSRILALADSYEAMTSRRAYRSPFSHGKAIAEIERCCETQFDPVLAQVFIAQWETKQF